MISILNFEQLFNAGLGHHQAGDLLKAEALYRQALQLNSAHPDLFHMLGVLASQTDRPELALQLIRQAIALHPNFPQAYSNLGYILKGLGRADETVAAFRQIVALYPESAQAHAQFANALKDAGDFDQAITTYHRSIALDPAQPDVHNNLGNAFKSRDRIDQAIAAYRRAIELNPNLAEAHNNLGSLLKLAGQLDQALAEYRLAMQLNPHLPGPHSNLLYTLLFHPDSTPAGIAGELQAWDRQRAAPLRQTFQPHGNSRDPERRIRVGYVSPDFCEHVLGRYILPLFRHHDSRQVEIFCYADLFRPDPLTEEFRSRAARFRLTAQLSDQALAELIRADGIDILVDLAQHMAGNRLLTFARKPAPVQVSFAGYPGSTGLSTIDYRISDPFLDPPGPSETGATEQIIRLPDSFWCYAPLDAAEVPVNPLPALSTGRVTFGCLNNFCKVNPQVLALWAQVMRAVGNSRLLLLAPEGAHRPGLLAHAQHLSISPDRIEFVPPLPHRAYLETYHRIDLGLDTFPYNGHTTSLDSLWMGVPVVTLVGNSAVARAGWCQLSNLGLTELAAHSREEFTQRAVALASDLPRLAQLRATLRQRMTASPLTSAPRFASSIETAYRTMWRAWCATPH